MKRFCSHFDGHVLLPSLRFADDPAPVEVWVCDYKEGKRWLISRVGMTNSTSSATRWITPILKRGSGRPFLRI